MTVHPAPPHVPAWACNKQASIELRKRNMLGFLFRHAALQIGPDVTLRQLGEACGLGQTAITQAIGRATVSEELASTIEALVGSKHFDAQWLLDPMQLTK